MARDFGQDGLRPRHYNPSRMRACRLVVAALFALELAASAQEPAAKPPRAADELPLARAKADATVATRLTPGAVVSDGALWFATPAGLSRVDGTTNALTAGPGLDGTVCGTPAAGLGAVWVPRCGAGVVARVEAKSAAVTTVALPLADAEGSVATGIGSLWVASAASGVVSRVDPDTREAVAEIYVAAAPSSVAFADATLWISSATGNVVTRVDAHTNTVVETITVGPRPGRIAIGDGAVWVVNRGDHSVTRIDPATNTVVATIAVGHGIGAGDIAVGAGAVWLSAPGTPLVRLDPATNRAAQRFTGEGGGAVAVAFGSVWVAAGPAVTWRLDPALLAALRP